MVSDLIVADTPVTRRQQLKLGTLVAAFAAAYSLIGLFKHWHFDSSAYDLGIFDQVIWRMSRFEAPISSVKGHTNIFGDHFHPIIALLAPIYWIAPRVEALLIAQSALLALSIVPVFAFARRRLPEGPAIVIAIVYGLFWGMQRTAWFDFHELAFAPLLIGIAINAVDLRRWRVLWLSCAALCLVKEDMIPVVTTFGAWVFLFVDRRQGLLLAAVSLLLFPIVMLVVIPGFGTGVWNYSAAFASLRAAPWMAPIIAVTPPQKIMTVILWLAPFLLLPLGSRWSLLAVIVALERLLSDSSTHWGGASHYSAPLAPILAAGTADTLSRIRNRAEKADHRKWIVPALLTLMFVASATLPGHQPVLRLFAAKHYRDIPDRAAANEALAVIPGDASVVALAAIVPHLSHRNRIYVLEDGAPEADFVIAATARLSPWPASSSEAVDAWLEQRRQMGYRQIFARDGWVVLTRQQAPSR
jgi:uncharacterized membrane protein